MIEIRMPKYVISMLEGEVVTWFKAVGDKVEKGEAVLEFSESKAVHEVEAPEAGTLTAIYVHEGETVAIGTVLGILE